MPKVISVLGSTGSIGTNVLDIVQRMPGTFKVAGLAAGRNVKLLLEQVERHRPAVVSVLDRGAAASLRRRVARFGTRVLWGPEASEEIAGLEGVDVVVSAITGMAGFRPTLAAAGGGAVLALANKESLVVGGGLIRAAAKAAGTRIVPVDSEHSGVFQCLRKEDRKSVRRVILTASGGPFLRTPLRELGKKTAAEALRHPRWRMGRKVTVDSATMMNKGLELIEARWLFDLPPEKLDVLIHPQSVVHALVELEDGSVLAQMSATDMRLPIQFALTCPGRVASGLPRLDLAALAGLEFLTADPERFPLLAVARRALEAGGTAPAALNGANEAAVEAFLAGKIGFTGIARVVERVFDEWTGSAAGGGSAAAVEGIMEADGLARRLAAVEIKQTQLKKG